LETSIDGILIPAPVPSSDMTIEVISSSNSSIIMATAAPDSSAFLTFYTNEQFPLSASTNGEMRKFGVSSPN